MSAADFRHIAFGGGPQNCERLFRASISAFCTLSRPTRAEATQLDDLALGLFDAVTKEARRFAAAALSECDFAPPRLVRRLCEEPVEISAPLLVRSRALSDVELIALIGRHGIPHARAIARRDGLHPVVAALIRALLARADSAAEPPRNSPAQDRPEPRTSALEQVRDKLRDLMQANSTPIGPEQSRSPVDAPGVYKALRAAALSGDVPASATTLARALDVSARRARHLTAGEAYSDLLIGLIALRLAVEEAFLVVAALYPAQVSDPKSIRLFLERYHGTSEDAAMDRVNAWRLHDRPDGHDAVTNIQSLANAK